MAAALGPGSWVLGPGSWVTPRAGAGPAWLLRADGWPAGYGLCSASSEDIVADLCAARTDPAPGCPRLPPDARVFPRLPPAARVFPRLPPAAPGCPRLPPARCASQPKSCSCSDFAMEECQRGT